MQVALVRTVNSMEREQASGTLELVLISPVPPVLTAIGNALYELLRGAVFAIFIMLASRFVFGSGLTLGPQAWAGIAFGLGGAVASFLVLSVFAAAVLISIRQGAAFASLLSLIIPVLSGAYFPTRVLPQPLEDIANAQPLTR